MFELAANTDLFIVHSPALPRPARAHANTRFSVYFDKIDIAPWFISTLARHCYVYVMKFPLIEQRSRRQTQAPLSLTDVLKLSDYGNIKMSVGLI